MGDPTGLAVGFAVEAVKVSIIKILGLINSARRCRKELESLDSLLSTLQGINSDLQKLKVSICSGMCEPSANFIPLSLKMWLEELDRLLEQANNMVQSCPIPNFHFFSANKLSKKIAGITASIEKHRKNASLIQLVHSLSQIQHKAEMAASSGSARAMKGKRYIEETLVVGQEKAFERLEQLVRGNAERIGVVGMGGSGKTLLLKRLFNRLQDRCSNDFLLWVSVSTKPSFSALRNQLFDQICDTVNERPESAGKEGIKIWLAEKLKERKFTLFLDDVWESSAIGLLEKLCVPSLQSTMHIIVSSRSHRALSQMGIPANSLAIVDIQSLMEDDSWKLFSFHAFPHNNRNLPPSITEEVARSVCKECGGLALAIKVIGRAMSAFHHSQEWESALQRLRNVQPISDADDVQHNLYGPMRSSYDSLDDSLQLFFLYLVALPKDTVIYTHWMKMFWVEKRLLRGDNDHQTYVNLLADRCLIEVILRDIDGLVTHFKVHTVLHNLARHIGLTEKNCSFHAGRGLEEFPDFGAHFRISLWGNKLSSIPNSLRGPRIRSLIMTGNIDLKIIPREVIASMTSLQILDLSRTSLQQLPKNIGCLKHLICLRLQGVPIKRLPNTLTSLNMLQILDLCESSIKKLPSNIAKLRSLRILDISDCKELQCVPPQISKLTTLEELRFEAACSPRPSINDLKALKHLKGLSLSNNGETIQDETLGNLTNMEQLYLHLTMMESLPQDICAMSKLRHLSLYCPDLTRVELSFCRFQQLSALSLVECKALKELHDLHKLASLKKLDILGCPGIEELPKEFGESGVFPKLEVLNLMWLAKLGELPQVDEAAMPSLTTLSIVNCESLKMLAEGYWNLKSMKKIGIYGCPMVLRNLQEEGNVVARNRSVQTITMSDEDTRESLAKYVEMQDRGIYMHWGEFWSNEFFQTLNAMRI